MKDKKEIPFNNWRPGAIHLTFSNGNWLSTTWANGSYSDNYNGDFSEGLDKFVPKASTTCEIMFECPERLRKKIYKMCSHDPGDSVIPYVEMSSWEKIVNMLSK